VAGCLQLSLVVRNAGAEPACDIYLCIPRVGIAVKPNDGWRFAGRGGTFGAIGVTSAAGGIIAPGQSAAPCMLRMPVMKANGGSIWACGNDQPLCARADIRLICTVGAANLAPARVCLRIAADDIRSEIAAQFPAITQAFADAGQAPAEWRQASA
jgi:hypothetical protein